jgi:hypothetical protein
MGHSGAIRESNLHFSGRDLDFLSGHPVARRRDELFSQLIQPEAEPLASGEITSRSVWVTSPRQMADLSAE